MSAGDMDGMFHGHPAFHSSLLLISCLAREKRRIAFCPAADELVAGSRRISSMLAGGLNDVAHQECILLHAIPSSALPESDVRMRGGGEGCCLPVVCVEGDERIPKAAENEREQILMLTHTHFVQVCSKPQLKSRLSRSYFFFAGRERGTNIHTA